MAKVYKKYHRGITKEFAEIFKASNLYRLYKEHCDELIIGIRNDYINIYYNCDSIAKVSLTGENALKCEINGYYLGEPKRLHYRTNKTTKKREEYWTYDNITLTGEAIQKRIIEQYEAIKSKKSRDLRKDTDEKKAQQMLVMRNNKNAASNWYCIDVEWVKQFRIQKEKEAAKYTGRFDIVAISRTSPHRVAIIELKYGGGAIGGESGVVKHLNDFKSFIERGYYADFKEEIKDIVKGLKDLEIDVPFELGALAPTPEFYFLTLNNSETPHQTAKQKMAAYLFEKDSLPYNEWRCLKASTKQAEWNILDRKSSLPITCLFSDATTERCCIEDIIDDKSYDRNEPK